MTSRWWSARALWLHATVVLWVVGCTAASIWQVGRAFQGNTLSYFYSFEWPIFGVVGVWGWWALIHIDDATEKRADARVSVDTDRLDEAAIAREVDRDEEDESLSAYNDHLARLAAQPKKRLFGH